LGGVCHFVYDCTVWRENLMINALEGFGRRVVEMLERISSLRASVVMALRLHAHAVVRIRGYICL